MTAYYNEIDPYAAEWLRNLISAGHIAPGDVDERSIADVSPDDLRGYTQCHFFAGIGVWSYALRRAGWPDDRPVWTGSCPCPPFSAAGKGSECPSCGGKSCLSHPVVTAGWICLDCGDEWRGDDRHLLPEFIRLKGQRRPPVVFGEQVASRDGRLWLYTLRAVMEEARYAVGAADLCAAGVGAPHIRQRLWFVEERLEHTPFDRREQRRAEPGERSFVGGRGPSGVADADGGERPRFSDGERRLIDGTAAGRFEGYSESTPRCSDERLAHHHHHHQGLEGRFGEPERREECVAGARSVDGRMAESYGAGSQPGQRNNKTAGYRNPTPTARSDDRLQTAGPVNGVWRDADWLFCRDGKWRPVEPGTFPLAHGAPARVGRLRAYGNAIVAQAAQAFIESYLEAVDLRLNRSSVLTEDNTDKEGIFS